MKNKKTNTETKLINCSSCSGRNLLALFFQDDILFLRCSDCGGIATILTGNFISSDKINKSPPLRNLYIG